MDNKKEQTAIVYGSLYMDDNEGWNKVTEQLDLLSKPNVVAFFFDVIGWKWQQEEGEKMVKKIEEEAWKRRPDLEKVGVGFSTNEKGKPLN